MGIRPLDNCAYVWNETIVSIKKNGEIAAIEFD